LTALVLLGKPDCHLCHVMREVVERVRPAFGLALREQDVRADERWRPYLLEIPVLLLGDREVARHRIDEATLHQRLLAFGLTAGAPNT
jgi:glutaredoxin-like protein DUF836